MAHLFSPDSVFLQRFLRAGGYYLSDIDGIIGPKSETALAEFKADSDNIEAQLGVFDDRSEKNIATLLLESQRAARKFMKALPTAGLNSGFTAKILSGTRTYGEQNALYAKGRPDNGPIVTNARGGQSNHNFGIAWDMGIFDAAGHYIDNLIGHGMTPSQVNAQYKKLGALGKKQGLFWGGDWHKPDYPHFQMLDNDDLSAIRYKFVNGGIII